MDRWSSLSTDEAAVQITRTNETWTGQLGQPANVTYGFVGTGDWLEFSNEEMAAAQEVLALWADVANVTFTPVAGWGSAQISFVDYNDETDAAVAATTGSVGQSVDVGFNLADGGGPTDFGQGGADRKALIHEIGHALGLEHPGDYNAGSVGDPEITYAKDRGYVQDSGQYTVMSYFGATETGADFGGAAARTPLLHDIAAMQRLYGANMTTRTGDTVYGYNSNADRAAFHVNSPADNPVFAIWDAGGIDTIDFSGSNFNQTIRLSADSFSSVNGLRDNLAIAAGADIENARGGSAVDTIYGNALSNDISGNDGDDILYGADGNDVLSGDGGNDKLYGGNGTDILRGGAGSDVLDGGLDGRKDFLAGGTNDDTYYVYEAETIVENDGEGTDLVITGLADYTLAKNVENLLLDPGIYQPTFTGRGNALDNVITGGAGQDTLYGNGGNDSLRGRGGVDTMVGGDGDDTYLVEDQGDRTIETLGSRFRGGHDTVDTSLGNYQLEDYVEDLRYIGLGNFVGVGNELANAITGGAGNDTLYGLAGDDRLDGGTGADAMNGGAGNDIYIVDNAGDTVSESGIVRFIGGHPVFGDMGGLDEVQTTRNSYSLATSPGVENLTYTGVHSFIGFTGHGNDGDNTITGGARGDSLDGGNGNDILYGKGGNDHLFGGNGMDRLEGGAGADTLTGGAGDDLYWDVDATDTVVELAGEGRDKVVTHLSGYTLGANVEDLLVSNENTSDTMVGYGNELDNNISALDFHSGVHGRGFQFYGYAGEDVLGGSNAFRGDLLDGGADNDILYGNGGADILRGGLGADMLDGGAGFDRADYSLASEGVVVDLVAGGSAGEALGDTYKDIEGVNGSDFADTILGTENADSLSGLGGADVIVGRGGNDTLTSGTGPDTFGYADHWGQDVITDFEVGTDVLDMKDVTGLTSFSQLTITDTPQGAKITFGGDTITLNGVTLAQLTERSFHFAEPAGQQLTGTDGADVLAGGAGGDVLQGLGGNDILRGNGGADQLDGGAGDDVLYVDALDTSIKGGDGYDSVYAESSAQAPFHFALAGTGVELVHGGNGADVIDASGTADFDTQLFGGAGNDTLIAGSAGSWTMGGGEGNDTAVFAGPSSNYSLDVDRDGWVGWTLVSNNSTGAVYWTNQIEHFQFDDTTIDAPRGEHQIDGTAGNDVLAGDGQTDDIYGLDGNDVLVGTAGNDILVGGAGADSLSGDDGNDVLYIDNNDVHVDGGAGVDYVYADPSSTQDGLHFVVANTNVEFVYGDGGNDVFDASGVAPRADGTGVTLWGNLGDDILIGSAGIDSLDGGGGFDTAIFSGHRDDYTFAVDQTLSSGLISVTDKATGAIDWIYNIENVQFADASFSVSAGGPGDDTIAGGPSDDYIVGLDGNDNLSGGGGNDILDGGAGRNELHGGDGNDTLVGGSEYDWIEGGNGNDTFVGTGGFMVMFGGDGDDRMTGSIDNSNYIDGGTGNDVMVGGNTTDYMADMTGGDDTMHGGGGDDTLNDFYGVSHLYGEEGNDLISAAGGSGVLDGGAGNDSLTSENGNYALVGGAGDDTFEFAGVGTTTFTGGQGADTFTYRVGPDTHITVTDFEVGVDHVFLWDEHYYGNVPLDSLTITDSPDGAVISWHGMGDMTLTGVSADQLTHNDFLV